MRMTLTLLRPALASCALLALVVGCSSDKNDASGDAQQPAREANVNLPPVPDLPLLDVPRQYPDKTLSVMGLLIDRDKLLMQPVTVSALVVDIYACDIPADVDVGRTAGKGRDAKAKADEPRPGCLYPHFYIADAENSPRRILVTGYDAAHYEPQLQPMTRYRFSGTYSVQARGFSSSEQGLILVDTIEGSGITQPTHGDE